MAKDHADKGKKPFVRHNEFIRIPQVLVIHDDKNLGLMNTRDALNLARTHNLDLVEVNPTARPPVCHIRDYGKFMFEKSKKEKVKSTSSKEKEVSFKYVIDDHDLETKANQTRRFLEKGMKVKLLVFFEKREKAHKDQGFVILNKMIELLKDVAVVERPPAFEGGNVVARVDLKQEVKKGAKKESKKENKKADSPTEAKKPA